MLLLPPFQISTNARNSLLVIQMLNVPTQLGPSLVSAMRDTVGMDGLVQVTLISVWYFIVLYSTLFTICHPFDMDIDWAIISKKPVYLLPCTVFSRHWTHYSNSQILMNVWSSRLVMRMLCVPTQLVPSRVPAMMDSGEMARLAQVSMLQCWRGKLWFVC